MHLHRQQHDQFMLLFFLLFLLLLLLPPSSSFQQVLPSSFDPRVRTTTPKTHTYPRPPLSSHSSSSSNNNKRPPILRPLQMSSSPATPLPPLPCQSILIIGAGAVGCLYGGRLLEAGHDVTFLMRRDYQTTKEKGLTITSPDGDMYFPQPSLVQSTSEYAEMRRNQGKGPVDWVVLALKTTSFADIPSLLGDENVVGKETRVLALMNGYGLEKDLCAMTAVEGKRIFGGMAFVCANRGGVGSGEVHHLKYGKLVLGHYEDNPSELEHIARLFTQTPFEIETTPNLLRARWMKLCWNMPFNGLGVCIGGESVDKIVQTPELRQMASLVMMDVIRAANVELALEGGGGEGDEEEEGGWWEREGEGSGGEVMRIEKEFHDHMFALTDVMGPYMSSTVLDLLASLPMETEYMFLKPWTRAKELGVAVPHMESVVLAVEGIRKIRGL